MKKSTVLLFGILTLCIPIFAESTVGTEGDFTTIEEALANPQPDPLTLILIDPIYTEVGLFIDREVTIIGSDRDSTIIQGALERGKAEDRVFRITKNGKAIFKNITIRHGQPRELPHRGGGIDNEGFVRLENCKITSNDAYYGGGVFTRGRVEMVGCILSDNRTMRSPTSLRTSGLGCNGAGGAIKTEKEGDLFMSNCSLFNNYSHSRGGAVYIACESRGVIINTTIAGNEARERAGGIYVKGDLYLTHTTIAYNSSFKRGSGITSRGKISMQGCLLANNSFQDYYQEDTHGYYPEAFLTDNEGNFVSDHSLEGAQWGDAGLKEMIITDEGFAIVPIKWNSNARNSSKFSFSPSLDQTGIQRDSKPDAGAWEWRLFR